MVLKLITSSSFVKVVVKVVLSTTAEVLHTLKTNKYFLNNI